MSVSYVPQEDILLNSATVDETFRTAIALRLGPMVSEDLQARVDATVRDLKLEAVRTSLIGGADIRGISGGEKRRVSIGQEMCSNTNSPVLLCDEVFIIPFSLPLSLSTYTKSHSSLTHPPPTPSLLVALILGLPNS